MLRSGAPSQYMASVALSRLQPLSLTKSQQAWNHGSLKTYIYHLEEEGLHMHRRDALIFHWTLRERTFRDIKWFFVALNLHTKDTCRHTCGLENNIYLSTNSFNTKGNPWAQSLRIIAWSFSHQRRGRQLNDFAITQSS